MAKRPDGFTLLELMVVVILLVVMATIAIPSFQSLIQNNRVTSQTNELLTAFNVARSEALKTQRPVAVCASNDDATCSGGWGDGWIVGVDAAGSAGQTTVTVADVVRVWAGLSNDVVFAESDDLPDFVRYLPNGQIDPLSLTFPLAFQIRMPGCENGAARLIEVTRTGRVSSENDNC